MGAENGFRYRARTFDPASKEPFVLSRTKIDLFVNCPLCFYLDQKLGVKRPSMPAFSLNNAVDLLLKKEFDIHRSRGTAHPLMKKYGLKAVPYKSEMLEEWRDSLRRGIACIDEATNFKVRGGVDDVWEALNGELIIVDYKATSSDTEVTLEGRWKEAYKRQMEIYQWLFRQNGFRVSETGYFVYVNGRTDLEAFDGKLEFKVSLLPYKGSDGWIPKTLAEIRKTLESPVPPKPSADCEYCQYRHSSEENLKQKPVKKPKKIKAGEFSESLF